MKLLCLLGLHRWRFQQVWRPKPYHFTGISHMDDIHVCERCRKEKPAWQR